MQKRSTIASPVLASLALFGCSPASDGTTPSESVGTATEAFTDATTWQQDGNTSQRAHVNGYDTTIARTNLAGLAPRWSASSSFPTSASIVGGRAYTGSSNGTVRALDVATGAIVWTKRLPGGTYYAPAVGYGRVFVTVDKALFALSATSGALIYRVDHASEVSYSAPLLAGNVVYVRDASGTVFGYDPKATGAVAPLFSLAVSASADPSVGNGAIYVPSTDGCIHAFSTSGCTGTCPSLWTSAPIGVAYLPAAVWPPRLVATVFGETDVKTVALDTTTGATLWSTTLTGAAEATGPAVGYGRAFVSTQGPNEVWALSLTDGSIAWKAPLSGDPTDTPSLANQLLYVPSGRTSGALEVFDVSCGSGGATCSASKSFAVDAYGYSPSIASGRVFFSGAGGTVAFALP
jgi:outer membrane protein assembly factor BamB